MDQVPSTQIEAITRNIGQICGIELGLVAEPDNNRWVFINVGTGNSIIDVALHQEELEDGSWVDMFVPRAFRACLLIIEPVLLPEEGG